MVVVRRTKSGRHHTRTEVFGSTVAEWWTLLLIISLVLFPKGGVKVGTTPITWGYLLLGLTGLVCLPLWVFRIHLRIPRAPLLAMGSLLPLQLLILYSLLANGVADSGFAISTCISLFYLPLVFLVLVPSFFVSIRMEKLMSALRLCMLGTAVYGIFLFFWHIHFGHYIEVPYLTVNAGDVGMLETSKDIDRGGLFKLISTYNNGNVYGAAMLILLPLFDLVEPRTWRKILMRVALALTLSRSVWVGMVILQLFYLIRDLTRDSRDFPLVRLGRSIKSLIVVIPLALAVGVGMVLMSSSLGVILDRSFGGRSAQFEALSNATLFPSVPVDAFLEIVYASAATLFGWAGLVAMILFLTFPIVLYATDRTVRAGKLRKAAFTGLLVYAIMCGMDGAFNYIPVMAFYWFAYMIFVYGDFGQRRLVRRLPLREFPRAVQVAPSS